MDILKKCRLCPRNCSINRYLNYGKCHASEKVEVSYYGLHMWEEPVISGKMGSGTVFFTHCNLQCIFCQNQEISHDGEGVAVSLFQLERIFLELQDEGAVNINLVTPTHYVPQIVSALQKIKDKSLKIPIVYNTSSYEAVQTIQQMHGLVDVYLADFKYFDDGLSRNYSHCSQYFHYASLALQEMVHQVGNITMKDDLLVRGVIVRVLVLPGHTDDAKKIISYLYRTYKDSIFISIMNQYTPVKSFDKYPNLNRKLTEEEYNEVVNYAYDLGVRRAFIQEGDAALENFIPNFDKTKVQALFDA